jgi:23S rRNA-/tRNA-specific pseudouridylate synthase
MEWVSEGEEVDISHWPSRERGNFEQVEVVYEDELNLVVYKPVEVVVEPGAGHRWNNLVTYLQQNRGRDSQQVWTVHRLDKNTQGLLILAKASSQQKFLQDQFRERRVVKKYVAMVEGVLEKNYVVRGWQRRDVSNPLRQELLCEPDPDNSSRWSYSIFKPRYVCYETQQTLVEVVLKTGRMHQIRVQAEMLGVSLVQEPVYVRGSRLAEFVGAGLVCPITPARGVTRVDVEEFRRWQSQLFVEGYVHLLANYLELERKPASRVAMQWYDF